MKSTFHALFASVVAFCLTGPVSLSAEDLRLATFEVDASPPIGSPLAYDPTREVTTPLSCRGIVLLGSEQPVVLCAVDWIGIANESNDRFRHALAEAAGTTSDRVAVHTLHQHDAPRCDLSAAKILQSFDLVKAAYDIEFIERTIQDAATAVRESLSTARAIDSVGFGHATVDGVASNRRLLDKQGKVAATRYTACRNPAMRALPAGVIDPVMRMVVFFAADEPVAALSYFATHPQSYYRTGQANPDFPGMARNARQQETGLFHVHFNGAGGNIGAGKYNDGAHENRQVLADRMAAGMRAAFEAADRQPITAADIDWQVQEVTLPTGNHLVAEQLRSTVADESLATGARVHAAEQLAFLLRMQGGDTIPISRLRIGDNYLLHLPGELFVEYQLAASAMRPDANVCMAAYGDYGTFYIGTRVAYPQGGYETSDRATNVAPEVEQVLTRAMATLLEANETTVWPSDFTETFGPGIPAVDSSNLQTD